MAVDVLRLTLRQQLDEIELLQVVLYSVISGLSTDLCFMSEGDVP